MLKWVASWKDSALQLLFPRVCPVCKDILTDAERAEGNPFLCRYCLKKLQFVSDPVCMKCGAPLPEDAKEYCVNCENRERNYDRGASLLIHDDNARTILYDLKYSGKKENADFLGLEAARDLGPKIIRWQPEVLIPVPLHRKRELERGFNQAALLADKLAENLEALYGFSLPVDGCGLIRQKKTRPQKELSSKERAENVKGKFCLDRTGWPPYQRVLLLDDIFTSGATLNECAGVLKDAGVRKVYFVTMSIVGD